MFVQNANLSKAAGILYTYILTTPTSVSVEINSLPLKGSCPSKKHNYKNILRG